MSNNIFSVLFVYDKNGKNKFISNYFVSNFSNTILRYYLVRLSACGTVGPRDTRVVTYSSSLFEQLLCNDLLLTVNIYSCVNISVC